MEGNVNWIPLGILGLIVVMGNQISYGHPSQAKAEEGLGWSAFLSQERYRRKFDRQPGLSG